jgi:hypothetical protein
MTPNDDDPHKAGRRRDCLCRSLGRQIGLHLRFYGTARWHPSSASQPASRAVTRLRLSCILPVPARVRPPDVTLSMSPLCWLIVLSSPGGWGCRRRGRSRHRPPAPVKQCKTPRRRERGACGALIHTSTTRGRSPYGHILYPRPPGRPHNKRRAPTGACCEPLDVTRRERLVNNQLVNNQLVNNHGSYERVSHRASAGSVRRDPTARAIAAPSATP